MSKEEYHQAYVHAMAMNECLEASLETRNVVVASLKTSCENYLSDNTDQQSIIKSQLKTIADFEAEIALCGERLEKLYARIKTTSSVSETYQWYQSWFKDGKYIGGE